MAALAGAGPGTMTRSSGAARRTPGPAAWVWLPSLSTRPGNPRISGSAFLVGDQLLCSLAFPRAWLGSRKICQRRLNRSGRRSVNGMEGCISREPGLTGLVEAGPIPASAGALRKAVITLFEAPEVTATAARATGKAHSPLTRPRRALASRRGKNLPTGQVTVPYHGGFTVSGGVPPYSWKTPRTRSRRG